MRAPSAIRIRWHLGVAMMCALSPRAPAQWSDTLTASQRSEIAQGRVVLLQQDVDGAPWPRVRLYRFIDATPEQSAAMLADYAHQHDYNADLKEATIVRRRDSARTEVFFRYASNVPLVKDVTYTVLDQLRRDPDGSYSITWRLLEGSKVKSTEGRAHFAPWINPVSGRAGTLLTYDNFVVPDFFGQSLPFVRNRAIGATREAVDAIAKETEREKADDPPLLERQVVALRSYLAF